MLNLILPLAFQQLKPSTQAAGKDIPMQFQFGQSGGTYLFSAKYSREVQTSFSFLSFLPFLSFLSLSTVVAFEQVPICSLLGPSCSALVAAFLPLYNGHGEDGLMVGFDDLEGVSQP